MYICTHSHSLSGSDPAGASIPLCITRSRHIEPAYVINIDYSNTVILRHHPQVHMVYTETGSSPAGLWVMTVTYRRTSPRGANVI